MNLERIDISKLHLSTPGLGNYVHIPQENNKEKFHNCISSISLINKRLFKHT